MKIGEMGPSQYRQKLMVTRLVVILVESLSHVSCQNKSAKPSAIDLTLLPGHTPFLRMLSLKALQQNACLYEEGSVIAEASVTYRNASVTFVGKNLVDFVGAPGDNHTLLCRLPLAQFSCRGETLDPSCYCKSRITDEQGHNVKTVVMKTNISSALSGKPVRVEVTVTLPGGESPELITASNSLLYPHVSEKEVETLMFDDQPKPVASCNTTPQSVRSIAYSVTGLNRPFFIAYNVTRPQRKVTVFNKSKVTIWLNPGIVTVSIVYSENDRKCQRTKRYVFARLSNCFCDFTNPLTHILYTLLACQVLLGILCLMCNRSRANGRLFYPIWPYATVVLSSLMSVQVLGAMMLFLFREIYGTGSCDCQFAVVLIMLFVEQISILVSIMFVFKLPSNFSADKMKTLLCRVPTLITGTGVFVCVLAVFVNKENQNEETTWHVGLLVAGLSLMLSSSVCVVLPFYSKTPRDLHKRSK